MSEHRISMTVNGQQHSGLVDGRRMLSDWLREAAGYTGVHVGCEQGVCGACTIIVDGRAVRSCLMLAVQADGADVTTIEGVSPDQGLNPLQQAFHEKHGLQCGFCTPGMVMTAAALLKENPTPTEGEVREYLSGNLCRCTGYHNIVKAIMAASGQDVSSIAAE